MASAIMDGIAGSGLLKQSDICVYDVNEQKRESFSERGFGVCGSVKELAGLCKYIVFSVKPQNMPDVLSELRGCASPETVYISIAAGISAETIKASLGANAKVVLVMPNTPLLIGQGATAMSCVEPTSAQEFAFAKSVFASAGIVEEIPPDKMKEVIPLNGSSPAYIYLFAKLFVEAGVRDGLDADVANRLFCQSLIGSAKMMLESGKTHQELIDMVTSPKGTTFEGLEALKRCGFDKAVAKCSADTVRRAYELGK